jgi:hypothetical protein
MDVSAAARTTGLRMLTALKLTTAGAERRQPPLAHGPKDLH